MKPEAKIDGPPGCPDLVSVTEKHVEYYGYVEDVRWDKGDCRVLVDFYPGMSRWFDLSEITIIKKYS